MDHVKLDSIFELQNSAVRRFIKTNGVEQYFEGFDAQGEEEKSEESTSEEGENEIQTQDNSSHPVITPVVATELRESIRQLAE